MSSTSPEARQSVIVVGAGPVGLTAALALRAYGLPVTVLEAGLHPRVVVAEVPSAAFAVEGATAGVDRPHGVDELGQVACEGERRARVFFGGGDAGQPGLHGPGQRVAGAGSPQRDRFGGGNGVRPRSSRAACASRSSHRSGVSPAGAPCSGKRAVSRSPIRKMALTVPCERSLRTGSPRHSGNWSSTSARTVPGDTLN